MAADILAGLRCIRHPASYFVWLPLKNEVRADQVAMALVRERISVSTAEPFATSVHVPHAIRLALGSVDLALLREALDKVKRVISAQSC
jgi:DNA-binding transcriptional MocR family regulator